MDFAKHLKDMVSFLTIRLVLGGAALVAALVGLITAICHVAGLLEIPLWAMAIGAITGAMAGIIMTVLMLPGMIVLACVLGICISALHQ